jgi:hypothetical protein
MPTESREKRTARAEREALAAARSDPVFAIRCRIGAALFGGDWIGELSTEETDLIGKHGPKKQEVDGGKVVEVIEPLSEPLARKLDIALGRACRMMAQHHFVIEWLRKEGLEAFPISVEQAVFDRAVLFGRQLPTERKRGRKGTKERAAWARIEADLDAGRLTSEYLGRITGKNFEARYGLAREMARKLMNRALKRTGAMPRRIRGKK